MSAGMRLEMRQSQGLVITPQLQQAIKLLQLSNMELDQFIQQELAENPFLTRGDDGVAERQAEAAPEREAPLDGRAEPVPEAPAIAGADGPDWPSETGESSAEAFPAAPRERRSAGGDEDLPSLEATLSRPVSLREHLLAQVVADADDPETRFIACALVERLDGAGYLREPVEELCVELKTGRDVIERALRIVQGLDPAGVGARDLRECLALQLRELNRLDPAMQALLDHLPALARADFPSLLRACQVDQEDLQDMIAEIRALNPRPGAAFDPDPAPVVSPDVHVLPMPGGNWRVEVDPRTLPRVLADTGYYSVISSSAEGRKAKEYLSERWQSANWLVKALDQRARTVLRVTKAIFQRQKGFLTHGPARLRPLVLRDIAEATGLHESTVSRATSDKYVGTPRGTFALKYFFSTGLPSSDGESSVSAEVIRQRIRKMIERETPDDILSDDKLVLLLDKEGMQVARRTVAKYRESLNIASSLQRRRAKALHR
ncbi:RNA polymerase factor sigma-54 [Geminicoccus roseus]|uniref:RNA polymerase factor sigma-54 n=1 Tax=Geminicoccus roseus TaxID=404900 RepID=UPI0003FDBF7A|nr:RNA polymerase factor sigma-54 [Geminicoccus roseus]